MQIVGGSYADLDAMSWDAFCREWIEATQPHRIKFRRR